MPIPLYDCHNHLQDERLDSCRDHALAAAVGQGVVRMVVNGSVESDWPTVLALARKHPVVLPSFGVHPWYVRELSPDWRQNLERHLDAVPSAIGEIGLDRWIQNYDLPAQEEVFLWQWNLAVERHLPVSVHCLRVWGRLFELLSQAPRLSTGFLLHSYGGPKEMVAPLVALGAYFSLSGYFAHERKATQRDAFKVVPPERLLLETDAPDMWPPENCNRFPLTDASSGKPLNHPANLPMVYAFAAQLLDRPLEVLAGEVERNFYRLFGNILPSPSSRAHRTEDSPPHR